MKNVAGLSSDPNPLNPYISTYFTGQSFGGVVGPSGTLTGFIRVEVTNPVDVPPPPGSGLDGRYVFTQLTATVYSDFKGTFKAPADTTSIARGRITVGPYYK
jgi:hypothetical protein